MKQDGKYASAPSDYKLPVCDVQTSRRNFPGYAEAQVFTLDELRGGDTSGHTDSSGQGTGATKLHQAKTRSR